MPIRMDNSEKEYTLEAIKKKLKETEEWYKKGLLPNVTYHELKGSYLQLKVKLEKTEAEKVVQKIEEELKPIGFDDQFPQLNLPKERNYNDKKPAYEEVENLIKQGKREEAFILYQAYITVEEAQIPAGKEKVTVAFKWGCAEEALKVAQQLKEKFTI